MPQELELTSDSPKITKCHGFLAILTILTAGPEDFWISCVPKDWVVQNNCLRRGFLGLKKKTAPATTNISRHIEAENTKKQRLHCAHTTNNATTAESKI